MKKVIALITMVIFMSGCTLVNDDDNEQISCVIYNLETQIWEEPIEVEDAYIGISGWTLVLENGNEINGNQAVPVVCVKTESK